MWPGIDHSAHVTCHVALLLPAARWRGFAELLQVIPSSSAAVLSQRLHPRFMGRSIPAAVHSRRAPRCALCRCCRRHPSPPSSAHVDARPQRGMLFPGGEQCGSRSALSALFQPRKSLCSHHGRACSTAPRRIRRMTAGRTRPPVHALSMDEGAPPWRFVSEQGAPGDRGERSTDHRAEERGRMREEAQRGEVRRRRARPRASAAGAVRKRVASASPWPSGSGLRCRRSRCHRPPHRLLIPHPSFTPTTSSFASRVPPSSSVCVEASLPP